MIQSIDVSSTEEQTGHYDTIPSLARRYDLPISWLYDRSRRDALPGMRRLGKYIRVHLGEFEEALAAGGLK